MLRPKAFSDAMGHEQSTTAHSPHGKDVFYVGAGAPYILPAVAPGMAIIPGGIPAIETRRDADAALAPNAVVTPTVGMATAHFAASLVTWNAKFWLLADITISAADLIRIGEGTFFEPPVPILCPFSWPNRVKHPGVLAKRTDPVGTDDALKKARAQTAEWLRLYYANYDFTVDFTLGGKKVAKGVNVNAAVVMYEENIEGHPHHVSVSLSRAGLDAALANAEPKGEKDWDDIENITLTLKKKDDGGGAAPSGGGTSGGGTSGGGTSGGGTSGGGAPAETDEEKKRRLAEEEAKKNPVHKHDGTVNVEDSKEKKKKDADKKKENEDKTKETDEQEKEQAAEDAEKIVR